MKADLAGIWLWAIADLNGDGRAEIVYTPTSEKRPRTYCDVHIARFTPEGLVDLARLRRVCPIQALAALPLTVDTIDEGRIEVLRADLDEDGISALFASRAPSNVARLLKVRSLRQAVSVICRSSSSRSVSRRIAASNSSDATFGDSRSSRGCRRPRGDPE